MAERIDAEAVDIRDGDPVLVDVDDRAQVSGVGQVDDLERHEVAILGLGALGLADVAHRALALEGLGLLELPRPDRVVARQGAAFIPAAAVVVPAADLPDPGVALFVLGVDRLGIGISKDITGMVDDHIHDHPDVALVALPDKLDKPLRIEPRTSTTDAPDPAGARSWLDWALENPIESDDLPADLSTNLDHYLYGTPKDDDDR